MKFNLQDFCKYLNVPYASFMISILLFSILLAFQLDSFLYTSVWVICIPIWLWDILAVIGAVLAIIIWHKNNNNTPITNNDDKERKYFRSILPTIFTLFLLIALEMLICINLSITVKVYWSSIFLPLHVLAIFAIISFLFTIPSKRGFVLYFDLHFISGVLQILFLALRLDDLITWDWLYVFIPSWLVLTLDWLFYLILVLTFLKIKIIRRGPSTANSRVRLQYYTFVLLTPILLILVIVFMLLLALRLDSHIIIHYSAVFIPFYVILLILICTSLTVNRSNPLWFGFKASFFEGILRLCPYLQEIANISYSTSAQQEDQESLHNGNQIQNKVIAIVPYSSILLPD